MARTTWGPLSTDEQNQIEFAPVGEPGVLVAGTAGGLLKRNADGTIGNSILSESGSVLTADGSLRFSLTTQAGLRFNSLTTVQRDALTGAAGDAVWNTTTTRLNVHNGSAWTDGFVRLAGDTMTGSLSLASGTTLNWNSDTILQRDAAGKLSLRNLANAQTLEVYGTTDAGLNNYRRLRTTMTTGGAVTISAEGLGTGASGNTLTFQINGLNAISISATNIATFGSSIQTASTGSLFFGSRSVIDSSADGLLLLHNFGTTDADFFLKLGVNTSAAAGVKRTGTVLQSRLNDDSGFATIQGKLRTDNAYVAGAVVGTGYVTITDSTGTAYRVPVLV